MYGSDDPWHWTEGGGIIACGKEDEVKSTRKRHTKNRTWLVRKSGCFSACVIPLLSVSDHGEHGPHCGPDLGLVWSLRCAEPFEATAMLQENNNNNYSCLERACESREGLQERERGVLPFAKLLEMGSFPELGDVSHRAPVRGFRAWAMSSVCARSRRWAALPPANPGPFLKRPDAMENQVAGDLRPQMGRLAHGRPAVGLGLQLDASSWSRRCGSRQGTLGALVTVATLKASARGGQMQTQCFLLQAKGRSYLCAAGRRRAPGPGLFTELTSAPEVHGLGDAASSERRPTIGKGSEQREGAAAGSLKVKPRPVRKWRTSCEVAFSIKERAPWDCNDREFPALAESQENRSMLASQTSAQDVETNKQEGRGTETSRTALAKICTQCRGVRDRSTIGLRRVVEDSGQSSAGVEEEEITSPVSGSCVCRLDPDPADPETGCGPTDQEGPVSAGMQDGLQPKSSPQKIGRFQDLLGEKSPRLGAGSKSEVTGAVRNAGNSEADLTEGAKALKETGSPLDKDPESDGRGDSVWCAGQGRGGLPYARIATNGPQSHSCEKDRLAGSVDQWTHLAAGSEGDRSSLAEVEDIPEQMRQSALSVGGPGEVGGRKDRPLDGTGIGEGVRITSALVVSPDRMGGQTISNGHPPKYAEYSCESRTGESGMEEFRLSGVWGGGPDGPEAGGRRRGAENGDSIWQPDNSLSRGLDSAATSTHAPPNPEAIATGLSSLGGRQDGVSLPLQGESQRQQGWQGGMVASGEGFLDVEQEGDDDFGLFIRAGEQPSWDDGFTDFQQVPCGTSESAVLADPVRESRPTHWTSGQTENPFHQSEDTWTAFSPGGNITQDLGQGATLHMQTGGQWWPQKATEELSVNLRAPFDVPNVFQEAFPSMPSSCPNQDPVLTLRQLLQGLPNEDSTVGDNGSLLDGLQDVNRIIGLKCKWAESHLQNLLLQSLHLDTNDKGHVMSSRANDSTSVGLPPLTHHTPTMGHGKTKLSYDINKNILV
ncbi:hypothetical protein SKAU_G00093350 [Synaphobranchus kaupii]|uniref:Aftiphilin clathrin-binding box domain-containing protein n=1 Tax=Synaphobranchus kaupii TaxID=118154 RepID=A0A9Q1FXM2_SYNKA|nr:hypothetical protein SKAU_G00093350 [Synaphobranchus kaupii]